MTKNCNHDQLFVIPKGSFKPKNYMTSSYTSKCEVGTSHVNSNHD